MVDILYGLSLVCAWICLWIDHYDIRKLKNDIQMYINYQEGHWWTNLDIEKMKDREV